MSTAIADKKLLEAKLKMWQDHLVKLEKEYLEIIERRGEAAREGDLRENAAYQMSAEDAVTWHVKINEVKKIILDVEKKLKGEKVQERA